MFLDTLLAEIAERATPDDDEALAVLRAEAARLDSESPLPQEAVAIHLAAVLGLARFTDQLPADPGEETTLPRAWRLVDELLFAVHRSDPIAVHTAELRCWPDLLGDDAPTAADVFYNLCHAHGMDPTLHQSPYSELVSHFPERVRQLFEWSLEHPGELLSSTRLGSSAERHRFIIGELGRLGGTSTADLLEPWVDDPSLGDTAVDAIRQIRTH
jgi:hypothetical protein